ncbi:MAG: hypothetical protein COA32_17560 [Fluviicola sp.]|nr:MAG: hypothetical protein COA32_17560 [Fluviicola sp.]
MTLITHLSEEVLKVVQVLQLVTEINRNKMNKILLITLFYLQIVTVLNAQDDTCNVIEAECKLFKNKKFVFHSGMYTSIKFQNDSVYIIPEILNITKDSISINKRIYISDKQIKWEQYTYPISSIKWINWDGRPRKKVRRCFYTFNIRKSNDEKYCK